LAYGKIREEVDPREKKRGLTLRKAFLGGSILGLFGYLWSNGNLTINVLTIQPRFEIKALAGVLLVASFIIGFVSTIRQRPTINPTLEGLILGFTAGFSVIPLLTLLDSGRLPTP
jgi:hypothetical protein